MCLQKCFDIIGLGEGELLLDFKKPNDDFIKHKLSFGVHQN